MIYFRKFLSLTASLLLSAGVTCADNVAIHSPNDFQVLSVSPNGQWACGVFVDLAMDTYPFVWNLKSGEIEFLSSVSGIAMDVANDGTVSGEYPDTASPLCYWRSGKRYSMEMPDGAISYGIAGGLSPDGRYMTGTLCRNNVCIPYIWENGTITRSLNTGSDAVAYAVSPDGTMAAGFNMKYNRTACLWPAEGTVVHFEDSPLMPTSPWNYSRNFSPDGKKLVYWGGWELSADESELYLYAIYDLATGERHKVKAPSVESDLEFYDISNRGLLVGSNEGRGYIWDPELGGMYIDDYLQLRGVNIRQLMDDFYGGEDFYVGQLPINCVVAVSEDENTFVMRYYNAIGEPASLAVMIDQDFSAVAPVDVKASQLEGINTVALTWKRPVGANNIRGYNIYRDGQKLNGFLPISSLYYYDTKASLGDHTYTVSAVTTAGVETKAEDISLSIAEQAKAEPYSLFARQKGANTGFVAWKEPLSAITHKHYYDKETEDFSGFNVYENVQMEVAIRYGKEEMANYSGQQITEVSFLPLGNHRNWKLHLYTVDSSNSLQHLYSQEIADVNIGTLNTIRLDEPQAVPAGDLIAAIEISVDASQPGLIGIDKSASRPGYSDLLRQTSESSYISAYESSMEQLVLTRFSWAIDLGLTATGQTPATIEKYNVYLDGQPAGSTSANNFEIPSLANGTYTVAVEAQYSDEQRSGLQSQELTIKANYPSVDEVDVNVTDETKITASWETPVDSDPTSISYTTRTTPAMGVHGNSSSSWAFMVGAEYKPQMLRGYDGYKVKALRFIPMSDAIFTLFLYENNQLIAEIEPEELTFEQWNTCPLEEEITLNENSTYRLIVDCFDPEPETEVFALDGGMPVPYSSDLFSIDNGETWSSLTYESGSYGSWMIGFLLEDADGQTLAVDGYDVAIDNRVANTERITDNTFTHTLSAGTHHLQVNTYYPGVTASVKGKSTTFTIEVSAIGALKDNTRLQLSRGENYLEVKGEGVRSVSLINAAGTQVAKAFSEKVDITPLASGVYIVKVETATGTVVHKIEIIK